MPLVKYKNKSGKRLRSVTTIIGNQLGWNKQALIAWYTKLAMSGQDPYVELQIAGRIGTLAHELIEAYITDKPMDQSEFTANEQIQARIAYNSFCAWHRKYKPKFIATELSLVSEKYQFGGTFDAIAKINNKNYLVDFKTSNDIYQEYEIQLGAYHQLWQEYNPNIKIHGAIILKLSKDVTMYEEKKLTLKDLNQGLSIFKLLLKLQEKKK